MRFRKIWWGSWWRLHKRFCRVFWAVEERLGELCKVPTLKGIEVSLSYIQCFLHFVYSSINVSIFHSTWLDILHVLFHSTDLVYILSNRKSRDNNILNHIQYQWLGSPPITDILQSPQAMSKESSTFSSLHTPSCILHTPHSKCFFPSLSSISMFCVLSESCFQQ